MRTASFALMLAAAALTGCRQDMHDQPKYKAYAQSKFFADGRASRPLIAGTVARGYLRDDKEYFTGKAGDQPVKLMPMAVTKALLERGQQRYNIYCTPCHGATGMGNGMIVQRGYKKPPAYGLQRLREESVGYFFDVITNGYGVMPDYASQIPPDDRWAIAAYIRVLQRAQESGVADVPEAELRKLKEATAAPAPAPRGTH